MVKKEEHSLPKQKGEKTILFLWSASICGAGWTLQSFLKEKYWPQRLATGCRKWEPWWVLLSSPEHIPLTASEDAKITHSYSHMGRVDKALKHSVYFADWY